MPTESYLWSMCVYTYIHPNTQLLSKHSLSLLLNTQSYNCLRRRWLALAGFYLGWACTQIADSTTNSRKRAGTTKHRIQPKHTLRIRSLICMRGGLDCSLCMFTRAHTLHSSPCQHYIQMCSVCEPLN